MGGSELHVFGDHGDSIVRTTLSKAAIVDNKNYEIYWCVVRSLSLHLCAMHVLLNHSSQTMNHFVIIYSLLHIVTLSLFVLGKSIKT